MQSLFTFLFIGSLLIILELSLRIEPCGGQTSRAEKANKWVTKVNQGDASLGISLCDRIEY